MLVDNISFLESYGAGDFSCPGPAIQVWDAKIPRKWSNRTRCSVVSFPLDIQDPTISPIIFKRKRKDNLADSIKGKLSKMSIFSYDLKIFSIFWHLSTKLITQVCVKVPHTHKSISLVV